MTLDEWLCDLEHDNAPTNRIELGGLLEECGYKPTQYADDWIIVYRHPEWHSLTFQVEKHTIPRTQLVDILVFLRERLTATGRLYEDVGPV